MYFLEGRNLAFQKHCSPSRHRPFPCTHNTCVHSHLQIRYEWSVEAGLWPKVHPLQSNPLPETGSAQSTSNIVHGKRQENAMTMPNMTMRPSTGASVTRGE